MPEMKTLTIGGTTYEVVDATARAALNNGLSCEMTPMPLDRLAVGDKISLRETISGVTSDAQFVIVTKNYNNTRRALLWRVGAVNNGVFGTNGCVYNGSTLDTYLNSTYLGYLDAEVQEQISAVDIAVTSVRNSSTVSTIQRKVFALSLEEVGLSADSYSVEGSAISYFNSTTRTVSGVTNYWTRTIKNTGTGNAAYVSVGKVSDMSVGSECSYIPAFTLPLTYVVGYEPAILDASGNKVDIPASQISGGVNVETGTYTGTSTYGNNNPTILFFGFAPKAVMIFETAYHPSDGAMVYNFLGGGTNGPNDMHTMGLDMSNVDTSYNKSNSFYYDHSNKTSIYAKKSTDGKTLYIYSDDSQYGATQQMNKNKTYQYIAIG